jgi:hypothetical protein
MIGKNTPAVERFWQECRTAHGIKTNDYHCNTSRFRTTRPVMTS